MAHPNARHFCSRVICPRFCGGGWSPQELLDYAQHYAGLEIFNANNAVRRMWSLNRWDEVLASASRGIWGFASDDCHDVHDERTFDRGLILVNSEIDPQDCRRGLVDQDTWRQNMLQNIRSGNFCAVVRLEQQRHRGPTTPQRRTAGHPWSFPAARDRFTLPPTVPVRQSSSVPDHHRIENWWRRRDQPTSPMTSVTGKNT